MSIQPKRRYPVTVYLFLASIFGAGLTQISVFASPSVPAPHSQHAIASPTPGPVPVVTGGSLPTPVISPNSGTFIGSVGVSITDSQNTVTILYTTDGSDPATSGTAQTYSAAFNVTSSETITAVAEQAGSNNSAETANTYTITQNEPVGTWTKTSDSTGSLETALLMTDGTVIIHDSGDFTKWWKLTPDALGNYATGTWSTIASNHVGRLYGETAVLRDGRVFYGGGEYLSGTTDHNSAEVYDPVANTWTATPDALFGNLTDSGSSILPDGTLLCSELTDTNTDIYNPVTNTWSAASAMIGGLDGDEETWVTLSDGSVLNSFVIGQRYIESTNTWVATGAIANPLEDPVNGEIGPAAELYDGRTLVFGATGHTDFYNLATNSWTAGPDIANNLVAADSPSCVEVNGKVLIVGTPAYTGPGDVLEYDPATGVYSETSFPAAFTSYTGRMLALPNGQVLMTDSDSVAYIYTPTSGPQASWRPSVTSVSSNVDGSYTVSGTQLNGLTNGSSYGDETNPYTHYPIVALQDNLGNVTYAKTYNFSQMNPSASGASQTANFKLPAGFAVGSYNLYVIASGVQSAPYAFSNSTTQVPTPVISPGTGSYIGSVLVTITDSLSGVAIKYTTDGSDPATNPNARVYTSPLNFTRGSTLTVVAIKSGYTNSTEASATYTITSGTTAPTPVISPASGTYSGSVPVTITDTLGTAQIKYTTDGTDPLISGTAVVYSGGFTLTSSATVIAVATATGYANSAEASASYIVDAAGAVPAPVFSPGTGTYVNSSTQTITDTLAGVTIKYTTDGSDPATSPAARTYSAPITFTRGCTVRAVGMKAGFTNSAEPTATITITHAAS